MLNGDTASATVSLAVLGPAAVERRAGRRVRSPGRVGFIFTDGLQ